MRQRLSALTASQVILGRILSSISELGQIPKAKWCFLRCLMGFRQRPNRKKIQNWFANSPSYNFLRRENGKFSGFIVLARNGNLEGSTTSLKSSVTRWLLAGGAGSRFHALL